MRPALRRLLAAEILIAAVVFAADTPHAWMLRQRLSGITFTMAQLQALVTTLAALAVIAVAVEAARTFRRRRIHRAGTPRVAAAATPQLA